MAAGIEAKLLCERLGLHRAVFVWEPSVLAVRLALRLHEYSEAIARERLILLIHPLETLGEGFVDWLRNHPGHLAPERLMMFPWQSWAELSSIRSVIEGVHRDAEAQRAATMAEARTLRVAAGGLERPRIAVLSLHAHELNWATADALAAAARALGGSATVVDIRGPGDMHPLARIERLRKAGDLHAAVLLDIFRTDVSRTPAGGTTRRELDVGTVPHRPAGSRRCSRGAKWALGRAGRRRRCAQGPDCPLPTPLPGAGERPGGPGPRYRHRRLRRPHGH